MPLPLAHALCGTIVVAALRSTVSLRNDWKPMALGAALAVIPDFDVVFLWVMRWGNDWHRGFTHSFVFAAAASFVACVLMRTRLPEQRLAYGLAAVSHCFLDFFTSKSRDGVELLWPFSMYRFTFGLFDYFESPANPRYHSLCAFILKFLEISFYEAMIFVPILLVLLIINQTNQQPSNY